MSIVFGFMILVDGWLTKLSAPIVIYDPSDVSGWRPVWDILAEEYAYAFALITLVLLCWERSAEPVADEDGRDVIRCSRVRDGVSSPWKGQLCRPPLDDARARQSVGTPAIMRRHEVASNATTCSRCVLGSGGRPVRRRRHRV